MFNSIFRTKKIEKILADAAAHEEGELPAAAACRDCCCCLKAMRWNAATTWMS